MSELIFISYVAYFIMIPLCLYLLIRKLWYDEGYLGFAYIGWTSKRKDIELGVLERKLMLYKVFVIFVVVLLLPVWGFAASHIANQGVRTEVVGGTFIQPTIQDNVVHHIGPTYDTDYVLEVMYNRSSLWFPELINEYVDLEELTSRPGRMAVYILRGPRYIITYTYLAPFPIVETHGFLYRASDNGPEIVFYQTETYVFPFNPGRAGDIADP